MRTIRIVALMGLGVVLGGVVGWLAAVTGASAAMRETMIDRDNYRDSHRATLQGVPRGGDDFVQMVKGNG